MKRDNETQQENVESKPVLGRRDFIKSATTAVAVGSAIVAPGLVPSKAQAAPSPVPGGGGDDRAAAAAAIRIEAAQAQLEYTNNLPGPQENNGDDDRYSDENYYASFTKCLPHNDIGEVDSSAYEALLNAVETGDANDYNAIPLDIIAGRILANPQGGLRHIFAGLDGHATRINPAPAFRSPEAAVEMAEVYWLAMTRDVPYEEYGNNKTIDEAIKDMINIKQLGFPVFQEANLTPETIFRGETPGDLIGPYISQFLWKDIEYGPTTIEQRYFSSIPGLDYMTTEEDWATIQRGFRPFAPDKEKTARYITSNRGLGEYVHQDILFQAYFNALLIILDEYGRPALDIANPYGISIFNQGSFTSLGGPWFIDLVTQAGNLALNGAWYQKWDVHRRLRPEAYAGRIHHHLAGNATYELPNDILNSLAVQRISRFNKNGSHFLPMAYIEGSPTHPSYVAGHAAVAGACCTVLKAICNENFIILDPVIPSPDGLELLDYQGDTLRLGNEINKLAANISLGRDAAGVHYRSDGIEGLLLGEQQAIGLLRDYSTALNEDFGGFHFTGYLGNEVTIVDGVVS